jgi:ABC-type antimicrobial peptide transport system ATPase subunit
MIKYVMLPKCYFKRLIWVVFNWKKRRHMSPIHIGTIRQEQLIIVLYYEISLRRIRSIWTLVCCFD